MVYKIVIVGDPLTGKTNLMTRFTQNIFSEELKPTIGLESKIRTINNMKLQVWDISQTKNTIMSTYYRNACTVLITFDLTNRSSFENLPNWISEVKKYNTKAIIVLVGTKSDLLQEITDKEVSTLFKYQFTKVSSKDHTNIDLLFSRLTSPIKMAETVKMLQL
jgi:small GTP-binding protein